MTDITTLPKKWESEDFHDISLPQLVCAEDLREALPDWTRITEDPETWPELGVQHLVICKRNSGGWEHSRRNIRVLLARLKYGYIAELWYRPLCDLDFPQEEES